MKTKELNRQRSKGREYFFCSLSCAAKFNNRKLGRISEKIIRTCPTCKMDFESTTHNKGAKFCSRSCASKGSVTDYRRSKAREMAKKNLPNTPAQAAKGLKVREAWKYQALKSFLERINEYHEFEYVIDKFIYDLVLPRRNIIFELDGKDHANAVQSEVDRIKDMLAESNGWKIIRIPVESTTIINPDDIIKHLPNTIG